jgi:nicotinamide-nucleotide amidase
MVFIAIADGQSTTVREFRFPGDRERVRYWASQAALELIRRKVRD